MHITITDASSPYRGRIIEKILCGQLYTCEGGSSLLGRDEWRSTIFGVPFLEYQNTALGLLELLELELELDNSNNYLLILI